MVSSPSFTTTGVTAHSFSISTANFNLSSTSFHHAPANHKYDRRWTPRRGKREMRPTMLSDRWKKQHWPVQFANPKQNDRNKHTTMIPNRRKKSPNPRSPSPKCPTMSGLPRFPDPDRPAYQQKRHHANGQPSTFEASIRKTPVSSIWVRRIRILRLCTSSSQPHRPHVHITH